jgi:hypothetical protein
MNEFYANTFSATRQPVELFAIICRKEIKYPATEGRQNEYLNDPG